mmetsp:Transcript_21901/g.36668  ORF Transcript_21901/g.36668 Transcript_21901/m.36668 type:complete len:133 (-) Transcript_21901:1032-1430(-)
MEISGGQPIIDIFLPTYRMEPEEIERFYPSQAKAIADGVIAEELDKVVYDEEDAKQWSINISDKIRESVTEQMGPTSRYKIVVQTTIGEMRDQGIRIASRCLWDPTTDNYASCSYTNETLFCSVLIFALYTD